MKTCPSERTLVRVLVGSASAASAAHVRGCAKCSARRDGLERDLDLVRTTLRDCRAPLPRARRVRWWPLLPAAAVGIALLALRVAVPPPAQRATAPLPVRSATEQTKLRAAVHEVSRALFMVGDPRTAGVVPRERSSTAIVQAALDAGWRCEDDAVGVACN